MSETLNTSTNRSTNGSTVEKRKFFGGGEMVCDPDGSMSIIFPQGHSNAFSDEVCNFFKGRKTQQKWDASTK